MVLQDQRELTSRTEAQEKETQVLPDQILIERSAQGDRDAFAQLAVRYFHLAFIAAYAVVNNREEAEDISQETMVKAFFHIRSLKDTDRFGGWIRSIARQEAYGRFRKISRFGQFFSLFSSQHSEEPTFQENEKERKIYHQQLLDRSLANLSSKAKEIVLLHYMKGFTCEQIASRLDLHEGTVKAHLFKARKKMLACLAAIGVHSEKDI